MCVVEELEQTRRCSSSNNHNYHPNQNFDHDQDEEEKLKQMPQTSGSSSTTECPVLLHLTILHLLTSNLLLALVSTIILSLVGNSAATTVVTAPCRRTERITTATSIRTTLVVAGGLL